MDVPEVVEFAEVLEFNGLDQLIVDFGVIECVQLAPVLQLVLLGRVLF